MNTIMNIVINALLVITGGILIVIFIKAIHCITIFCIKSVKEYNLKCPKCGKPMKFLGNYIDHDGIIPITDGSKKKRFGYGHVYQCPYCGTGKII